MLCVADQKRVNGLDRRFRINYKFKQRQSIESTWQKATYRLIVIRPKNQTGMPTLDNCKEQQTLDNYQVVKISLDSEDGENFLEKVINPPEPNEALKEAFLYYQEVLQS